MVTLSIFHHKTESHRNFFSAHPYLLFNQDEGHSMTFMGLWIDQQCNLIHICNEENKVVESNYMNKQLREALDRNGVKFMEEYNKLGK